MTAIRRDSTGAVILRAAAAAGLSTVERTLRRGEATPLHVHPADEAYHVVDGELALRVGPDTVRLRAGDSYVAPAGIPHAHRAESARVRVRTATAVVSAARYADFALAAAVPSDAAPAPEEEAALVAIAAANGIVVLAAPRSAAAA